MPSSLMRKLNAMREGAPKPAARPSRPLIVRTHAEAATFERFSAIVGEKHPSLPICRPWFEHVLAGPMDMLLRMGFAPEDAHARLLETFPDYEWRA